MCGITGWMDWKENMTNQENIIRKMAKTLEKRGPDATNIYTDHHIGLGHTRLAVVDISGGAQPMTRKSKDGNNYTIVYNGELYNTEELRQELARRGYSFQGHSDTEVLLLSYIEWKEGCLDRLNGIFAFAIWGQVEEKLFIARDRLGVKPLFYKDNDSNLLFGSELKAILAHPKVNAEITREGLQEVFGLGPSRTPGHGVYKGINELRPAHFLIYDRNGLQIKRYWNVESKVHSDSLEETIAQVKLLVTDAIERQLVSDVPLCTFLSGGLDSSGISAVASNYFNEHGKGILHTYSIDYENNSEHFQSSSFQQDEDRPWIQQMVKHIGSVHHSEIITQDLLATRLEDAVLARDLPGMADIDSSLLWFSEKIKQDFTVALSGECADEIFGGYPWFHRKELLEGNQFPWMKRGRDALLLPKWQEKLQLEEYVKERYLETQQEVPRLEGESAIEAKRRELFYFNMIWFMTTLLERKDRMSMRASLEVRVPFADHRLVEYVWNIPWEMKMVGGREKGILRKAFEGVLPHDILYRKKNPYPKNHHPTYTKLVKDMLTSIINKKNSPILELMSEEKLRMLIESDSSSSTIPWFGQLMTGPQVLAHFVQINMWLEAYNVNITD
ncbi:asparagine synthase (glutamine-hydrolyzing) [Ornithinibacillus halotolerans]|uniref:asparagine synthase (glutamine-hydrolyzing) n=1 Tax=Ornithinibacillus halotolerans TaxID=1274357 RepID=A0A916W746_9BACI|nr:asparagine synthase (glutamine-hydrolyzing) [Ornithinibacillus halotolerans]GGA71391.1 asparagine synthetase [glutamine-hydrolyzing] 3 [Ornithinibacillus halotolerans]